MVAFTGGARVAPSCARVLKITHSPALLGMRLADTYKVGMLNGHLVCSHNRRRST